MPKNPSLRESTREDGLRIITKRMPNTSRMRIAVRAGVGTAHDPPGYEGLQHFYEHMAFAGTTSLSSAELNAILGHRFRSSNAETSTLSTTYYGEAVYTRFKDACDVLLDVYLNPVFPSDRLRTVRRTILNEIARDNDDEIEQAKNVLSNMLWKKNPQRLNGLGTVSSVRSINTELLAETHRRWYVPSNTVIVGTGKIDHDLLTKKAFSIFPLNCRRVKHRVWPDESDKMPFKKEEVIKKPGRKRAVICIGCKIPPFEEDKDIDISNILNRMMGGGEDSFLFQEVREDRGLAYSIYSELGSADHKLGYYFFFTAEVLPEDLEQVRQLMMDIICNRSLDRRQFDRHRESEMDDWLVDLDNPAGWEEIIIKKILEEGKELNFLHKYAQRRRRTLSEIKFREVVELRHRFLTSERLACAVVRPS